MKIKTLVICSLFMMCGSVQADPWKDESGHSRRGGDRDYEYEYEYKHEHGKHKEKYKKKKGEGHYKHREVPPGQRKKYSRGHRFDESDFRGLRPVPHEVLITLPPLPTGISYRQIEGEIIKVHNAHREILEVLEKTLPPLPGLRK